MSKELPGAVPPHKLRQPSRRVRRWFPIAAGYLIIAVTLWAVWDARRASGPIPDRLQGSFGTNRTAAPNASQAPVVYFIFQPHDCADALHVIERWNAAHLAAHVQVTGIMIGGPRDEATRASLVAQAGISFPVRIGNDQRIHRSISDLGFSQTPIAIVTDHDGRVRRVLPGGDLVGDRLFGASLTAGGNELDVL